MQSLTFHSIKRGNIVMDKFNKKVKKVMREYKSGSLHSGKSGPVVKDSKQAQAIALSEARKTTKQKS
jgi:hypothetical protein